MSDFANSYEQKAWERALESHARYKRAIAMIEKNSLFSRHHLAYWQTCLEELEKKYPMLKEQQ
jgi:hypothetical protein